MTLSDTENKQIENQVNSITEKIEKIDKVLKPYRRGDTPTNNIYRWYGEDSKIGQLLKMKDKLILKRHVLRVQLGTYPF